MTTSHDDLVAFVHGELDADAARAVRERLAQDPVLRAELGALRAADAALLEALEAPAQPRRRSHWWRPLAAAAALVVVAVLLLRPRDDAAAAGNGLVNVRVQPAGGAMHPVFTDVALELHWDTLARDHGWLVDVLPYHTGDTLAALGRSHAESIANGHRSVPLVVAATVFAPDGQRLPARLAGRPQLVSPVPVLQLEPLRAFELETDAPPPYLGGRPGDREWVDDFRWAYEQMPGDGPRRLLLDQVGEWTLELRVESVPPPQPGLWPTFAEPLVVATKVFATGLVSAWGEPFDGLQARLVLATGCADPDRAPLALQLRNVSDRTRRYNVVGRTQAKIPQPFHWQLFVGGDPTGDALPPAAVLRDDLPVLIAESVLNVPHPRDTIRSLVVRADYWRGAGLPLAARTGPRTLTAKFHFRPTAWSDLELWQGEITSGALRLPPPDRR